MKTLSWVFKWIGIYLLLMIALAILGIAYLYIFPGNSLFGVRYLYYSSSENTTGESFTETSEKTVSSIDIDSGSFELYIQQDNAFDDTISVVMKRDVQGLTYNDKTDFDVVIEYDEVLDNVSIYVVQPNGVFFQGTRKLYVYLPDRFISGNVDISLSTSKADMYIGYSDIKEDNATDSDQIILDDAYISTDSGDIYLVKTTLRDSVHFDIANGTLYKDDNTRFELEDTYIDINNGTVAFGGDEDNIPENFELGSVIINNDGNAEVRIYAVDYCEYYGYSGILNIYESETLSVVAYNTNVNIDHTIGVNSIILKDDGKVSIGSVYDGLIIDTDNADVYIDEIVADTTDICTDDGYIYIDNITDARVLLYSDTHDITVNNAYYLVDARTYSGDINITYADDALDNDGSNSAREAMVETVNGNITLIGVDYCSAYILQQGSGEIYVKYNNVANKSSIISSYSGNITLITHNGVTGKNPFALYVNTYGYVNIKVGLSVPYEYYKGSGNEITYNIYDDLGIYSYGSISVSSNTGNMYIRDESSI